MRRSRPRQALAGQERTLEQEGGFMPRAEFETYVKESLAKMVKLGKQYGVYK